LNLENSSLNLLSQNQKCMELQDELIKQLFEQVTVNVTEEGGIKAISYTGFDFAVKHLMKVAYLNGQKDCIENVSSTMKGVIEDAFAV